MSNFWELLRESTIVQALITLMVVGAVVYLGVTNQPIPPFLTDVTSLVIGFYFGAKVQSLVHKAKG